MLFAAALSLLGSVIAIRMFKQMIAEKLFSEREMTKIGTACLCFQITLAVLLPRTYLALWCAIFSPLMICLCALTMLVRQRSQAFRESFRQTLALVSLKMKAGRSFRQSYSEVISESDPKWRGKHSDILNAVVFSQQRVSIGADLFVLEAIEELTRIDQQPHAAARRLQVYREKLRIEFDFRRRSGQVLARIRAQSTVMTCLYLALASFVVWKFGWSGNSRFVLASSALFAFGAFWIWRGGRKMAWKV